MELSDLDSELMKRAEECTTLEELGELCAAEGIALSDDELAALAGGHPCGSFMQPPSCLTVCGRHSANPCPEVMR